jgi:hypothetical protein
MLKREPILKTGQKRSELRRSMSRIRGRGVVVIGDTFGNRAKFWTGIWNPFLDAGTQSSRPPCRHFTNRRARLVHRTASSASSLYVGSVPTVCCSDATMLG